MDFEEMNGAYQRATERFVSESVADLSDAAVRTDDLKQRLVDKHAVTYDPICLEAANELARMERYLRRREVQLVSTLRIISTAVSCLSEVTKMAPTDASRVWEDRFWPFFMAVTSTFDTEFPNG